MRPPIIEPKIAFGLDRKLDSHLAPFSLSIQVVASNLRLKMEFLVGTAYRSALGQTLPPLAQTLESRVGRCGGGVMPLTLDALFPKYHFRYRAAGQTMPEAESQFIRRN
jgi:hypothetical protein